MAIGEMRSQAEDIGAKAIVDLDYESIRDTMLMVSANGTAVRLE